MIGNVFGNRNLASQKSELVIFLRPLVIRDASVDGPRVHLHGLVRAHDLPKRYQPEHLPEAEAVPVAATPAPAAVHAARQAVFPSRGTLFNWADKSTNLPSRKKPKRRGLAISIAGPRSIGWVKARSMVTV